MRTAIAIIALAAAVAVATLWTVARPGAAEDPARLFRAVAPDLAAVLRDLREAARGPGQGDRAARLAVPGGDPARAPTLMKEHGCGTCHVIPGLPGAHGTAGPSLEGFARRAYVGGVLSNRPGELIDWLMDPPAFSPDTAMPELGITEPEARHLAAYLYELR